MLEGLESQDLRAMTVVLLEHEVLEMMISRICVQLSCQGVFIPAHGQKRRAEPRGKASAGLVRWKTAERRKACANTTSLGEDPRFFMIFLVEQPVL